MKGFVALRNFGTSMEADLYAEVLRENGIGVLLQGPQAGMFGAGFSGASVQGVTLLVAEADAARAAVLIGGEQGGEGED